MAYYFANYLVRGCAAKVLLSIFLMFLGLRRRPYGDSILIQWISEYYYCKSLLAYITDFTFIDIRDSLKS